jgi:hypothetical protein
MDKPRCPACGGKPITNYVDYADWWETSCDNCYDGAPDSSSRSEVGIGPTAEKSVRDWLESVELGLE